MNTRQTRKGVARTSLLAVGAILSMPLVAFGAADDDGHATTTPIDALPEGDGTDPATGEDLAAACEDWAQISALLSGAADPATAGPLLEAFAADPPTRLTDAAPLIASGLEAAFSGDEAVFGDPEFVGALSTAGGYLFELCELDARIDVEGADYVFFGIPAVVDAGRVGIRLANTSVADEPHELILMRRPDGDARSIDEVVALGPEALFGEYTMVGVVWADVPASTMSIFADLEPGEYLALCTLPVGDDVETMHLHAGMIQTFSVR